MLALLLSASLAHAEAPMPKFEKVPTPVMRHLQEVCFPSGLRVTLRVDDREPAVSVTTVIDRGANGDPVGREGSAHLVEHLWFRARPEGGASVHDQLVAAGASWDAHTMSDATVFVTEAPRGALADLLRLEAARLQDPLVGIEAAAIDQERARIRTELALPGDPRATDLPRMMPDGFFPEGIERDASPQTTLSLGAITTTDLHAVADAYAPHTSTIYISGSFDPREVTRLVQDLFPEELILVAADGTRPEDAVCAPRARERIEAPPERKTKGKGKGTLSAVHAPVAAPWLVFGWAVPPAYGTEGPGFRLAEWLVERRLRGVLVGDSIQREERFSPSCTLVPGAEASSMLCTLKVPPGTSPDKLLKKALSAVSTTSELGTSGEEYSLLRHRALHIIDLTMTIGELSVLRGSGGLADAMSNHFVGTPLWFVDATQAYNAVVPSEVRALFDTWLAPARAVGRVLVPPEMVPEPVLAATGAPDLHERGGDVPRVTEHVSAAHPVRHHVARALPVSGESLPALEQPLLADPVVLELDNGLRIVALRHGDVPTYRVAVVAGGDRTAEPLRGLYAWGWDQLAFSREDLPEGWNYTDSAARIGARSWIAPGQNAIGYDGTVGNLEDVLWLLRHSAGHLEPFPAFDIRREGRFAAEDGVAVETTSPEAQAHHARMSHLLGEQHPLHLTRWDELLAGATASERDLKEHFLRTWRPENLTVVLVGGFVAEDAAAIAKRMFEDWPRSKGVAEVAAAPTTRSGGKGRATATFTAANRVLTEVEVACTPSSTAADAVHAVGEELVRLRVVDQLRTAGLAAYRPVTRRSSFGADVVLHVSAEVQPGHAAAANEAMLAAISSLATPGPADPDVAAVAAQLARRHTTAFTSGDFVLDALMDHGADVTTWARTRPDQLLGVTGSDVQAWAATCAGREAVTLIGPTADHVAER